MKLSNAWRPNDIENNFSIVCMFYVRHYKRNEFYDHHSSCVMQINLNTTKPVTKKYTNNKNRSKMSGLRERTQGAEKYPRNIFNRLLRLETKVANLHAVFAVYSLLENIYTKNTMKKTQLARWMTVGLLWIFDKWQ